MSAILGKKLGMTHVFTEDGKFVSVTAVEAGPCPVLSVKEKSVQLGFDLAKENRVKKPIAGFFKKINVAPRKLIREFLKDPQLEYKVGQEIKVDLFKPGDFVDVTGISIGKGFQGGMKRWHWRGGPSSHGSMQHRQVGSVGASSFPSRIHKGKTMPGHMGHEKKTIQNIEVLKVDKDNNLLVVKGSVPGPNHSYIVIREAKKRKMSAPKLEAPQGTVKKEEKKKDKR